MEESNGGENSGNQRQPPKREGNSDVQDGQPIAKRLSVVVVRAAEPTPDNSSSSTTATITSSVPEIVVSVPENPAEEQIGASMCRIFLAIEQAMGQSMVDIAQLFVRNEPALRNYVRSLRRALNLHRGHLEPCVQQFFEALGTEVRSPSASRTVSIVNFGPVSVQPAAPALPELPTAVSERSAKEILRLLGRILDRLSEFGGQLDMEAEASPVPNGPTDGNSVVRALCEVMIHVGEFLQYTYRSDLDTLAANLEALLPTWKTDMDFILTKLKENPKKSATSSRTVQPQPRLFYPDVPKPVVRYQIMISSDDLRAVEPEKIQDPKPENSQPQSSFNVIEHTLMLRYGSEEFINGQRTTRINYQIHGISFEVHEIFSSSGWVHPASSEGQSIRWISFNISQFEEGTSVYRIQDPEAATNDEEVEGAVIIVSGVLKPAKTDFSKSTTPSQRIEFVFVLPSHLSRKSINDGGIRDEGVIKIQFAK